MEDDATLPGRSCGDCTLCCKLLGITELDKPRGTWCRHCEIGAGCRIYDDRPSECREFYCGYRTWAMASDHWFPARSKMVIASELNGERIVIHVDPGRPNAWREQPYYRDLKQWAAFAARDLRLIIIAVGKRSIVILPDDDVDLGVVAENERIVLAEVRENGRVRLRAMKIASDDPRLRGAQPGAVYGAANNPLE